jgi:nitrite reductase/ring-hydroxylating ferredoxin subunit
MLARREFDEADGIVMSESGGGPWGDRVFAVHNLCTHQGGPVCHGVLSGRLVAARPGELTLDESAPTLACPWHGWEFDLATGRALLDDKLRIRTFAARIVDGRVLVDLK